MPVVVSPRCRSLMANLPIPQTVRTSVYNMSTVGARDRLVEQTAELLWSLGYTAMSPRDVQRAAGVGQGSMYHHFSGKADLAREAIQRTSQAMRREADALRVEEHGLDALRRYLSKKRDALRGCRLGRLVQEPDVMDNEELRRPLGSYFEHLIAVIADELRRAQATGDVESSWDASAVAATAVATVQGAYVLARATGDPELFAAAVTGLLSVLGLRNDLAQEAAT